MGAEDDRNDPAGVALTPLAQERAWNLLLSLAEAPPQGLVLAGNPGVGKRRSVRALFQWMNCSQESSRSESAGLFGAQAREAANRPCGACPSCRKVASGNHVDFTEIKPTGESISVDELREMKKSLFFPPVESRARFVLIDDAHKLTVAAANTLLKTLEEPPPHTRFFLVTSAPALLLPTITSRCQLIRFAPLPPDVLWRILKDQGIDVPEPMAGLVFDLLEGGLERARLLSSDETLEFLEEARAVIGRGLGGWDAIARLGDKLAAKEEDSGKLELFLDLLVREGRARGIAARSSGQARQAAALSLRAAYLRRRLSRYANRKLVGLAAASLVQWPRDFGAERAP